MKVFAALIALISLLLAGCGGGSYSETNMTQNNQPAQNIGGGGGSANADPQGSWTGTTPSGTAAKFVILENGESWSLETTGEEITGAYYGQTTVSGDKVIGQSKPIGSSTSLNVTGTLVQKSSMTLSQNGGALAVFSYDSTYDKPATSATLKGSWSVEALSASTRISTMAPKTVTINDAGAFTYNETNCAINLTMVPRATGKNIYNVAITFVGTGCLVSDVPLSGIGSVNTNVTPHRFFALVLNSSKTDGIILGGVKQGVGTSGATTTPTTFNLAQGLANFAKVESTKTFNIDGSSAAMLVFTNKPETSTALFEGSTRSVVTVHRKFSLDAPCWYEYPDLTSNNYYGSADLSTENYYDSKYNLIGIVNPYNIPLFINDKNKVDFINSNSYATPRIGFEFDVPVNVRVGDTGGIGIFDLYTDASKTKLIGQMDYFYTISADEPASPSSVKVAFSIWILSNKVATIKETRIYRLDLNSQMTLLSIEFATDTPLELRCRLVAKTKD